MKKKQWNGRCPSQKHGLDYEGQECDLCPRPPRVIPVEPQWSPYPMGGVA